MMAWIPQLFDSMRPCFSFRLAVFDRAIDEQEVTAGAQDATALPHERRRRAEMMRRHATRHQVEPTGLVGKLLSRVKTSFYAEPAFARGLGSPVQHWFGDISECDLMSEGCEEDPRVPSTGGNVQDP